MAYDLSVKNGRIVDGSGMPAFLDQITTMQRLIQEGLGLGRWVCDDAQPWAL